MFRAGAYADRSAASDRPRNRGFRQPGAHHTDACDFAKARRVFRRLAPFGGSVRRRPAGFQLTPHRFLDSGVLGNMKRQIRHRRRPVLPGGKGALVLRSGGGAKNNPEGRGGASGLTPALPKPGSPRLRAACLCFILDPEQFEHRVAEEKPAARGALSGMQVGRSLRKAKLPQAVGRGRAGGGADEGVIEDGRHLIQ